MSKNISLGGKLCTTAIWVLVGFFILKLFAVIGAAVTSSFATRWLGTWLSKGWTGDWYRSAWSEFQLPDVLLVRFQVVALVVILAAFLGVPAAYAFARREFPGKKFMMLLFLLPLLVLPITYGIPLATVLYRVGLAGSVSGVVITNLVPSVTLVVLVMIPLNGWRRRACIRREHAATFHSRAASPYVARRTGRLAAGPRAHDRNVRANLPYRGPNQPDATCHSKKSQHEFDMPQIPALAITQSLSRRGAPGQLGVTTVSLLRYENPGDS